ncbi:hypothetical protein GF359_09895 [candidate division WOR-3 bacterium]|uniref:HNH nuclease domain-containing protein n=1 Tax=candidate division WOR-3 bacterium TaxID=2052148 RepID=A0A9D5KAJ2_UNCW3|nr:hypothetical protein [candidate division WOR-3 bacterium]MBD3365512.1 hypothetical protein [candidate division WOR-3 bacterium]
MVSNRVILGRLGVEYLSSKIKKNLGVCWEKRTTNCVIAKIAYSYFMKRSGLSLSLIGKIMKKDHSTIKHYLNRVENFINSPAFINELEVIESLIGEDLKNPINLQERVKQAERVLNNAGIKKKTLIGNKNQLIIERGYRCELCGFYRVVQMHHIDGNRQNRHRNNLILLCPNCHAMVHKGFLSIENLRERDYPYNDFCEKSSSKKPN